MTAAEAAAFDRAARESAGVPERVLMENAGRSAALILSELFPEGSIIAAIGGGHNGGDALVALRTLRAWGRDVAWTAAGARTPEPALLHGHELRRIEEGAIEPELARAGVLIDGLLGTGAAGAPRPEAAALIRALNASGRPIMALDVPSGVDPTTGEVAGEAVVAAVTVTFGAPKTGLLFFPGRSRCGRLMAVEIGFPPLSAAANAGQASAALLTHGWAAARLPVRPPDAHKGTAGELLLLAGNAGMAGAAAIAAESAYRAGAGVVRVASTASNRQILQAAVPEAIFVDRADRAALELAAERADAVLAGPGIGLDEDAARALEAALELTSGPVLLDADALTQIGRQRERLRPLARERVVLLTPHPGEMARLSGTEVEDVMADRIAAAREFAADTGCTVLLKGAPAIIAANGWPVLVNTVGSSDVAKAGAGDQLAGAIAAFLAGGSAARDAAGLGLFYSGLAAELAGLGRSLTPRGVAAHLSDAFALPLAEPVFRFVTFDQPARW